MTTAQQISDKLDGDGSMFVTGSGEYIEELCRKADGDSSHWSTRGLTRWEFADDSAIVVATDAWDIRPDGCTEYCWAGEGCLCCDCDGGETTDDLGVTVICEGCLRAGV